MPIPIFMPKFNNLQEDAVIVAWLAKAGETIFEGDPICEVETDKVNMEVETPENGVLAGIRFAVGDTVPVTEIIAHLLLPGETSADLPEIKSAVAKQSQTQPKISPIARRVAAEKELDIDQIQGSGPYGRILRRDVETETQTVPGKVRATPAARFLARQKGVDLTEIAGGGPNGRIQKNDVAAQLDSIIQPTAPQRIELNKMRRTIAARMQTSVQTAPHIFVEIQVDTTRLDALRTTIKRSGERLTVTAVLTKASAVTLKKHPQINATHTDNTLLLWPTVNIGVVVALENGLVVPVLTAVEKQGLSQLQTNLDKLTEKAHTSKLTLPDIENGTFTLSNLGMLGVTRFTAIINQPQVAILAVGTTVKQFVPDAQNQPVLRGSMTLTLSVDHRFIDGAAAAHFLADLKAVLEEPGLLAW